MPGNATGEGLRWQAGGAVARPRLAGAPPNRAAHPDAAEVRYLEETGRRAGPDRHTAATGTPVRGRGGAQVRGRWRALVLALALGLDACSRPEPLDPAAAIGIGPQDVRIDAAPVARTVSGQLLPPVPHVAGAAPLLNGQPARLRLRFDGEPLPAAVDPLQRQVLVYPLAAYRALFLAGEQVLLDEHVAALRRLLAEQPEFVDDEEIPVLPEPESAQAFRARIRYLRFDGGAGVAFITRYAAGAASPAGPLVWTFQGVTDDGRYWVSAFHPVHAPGLPKTGPAYTVARHVDAMHAEDFRPSPDALAAVARTLRIREPPPPAAAQAGGARAVPRGGRAQRHPRREARHSMPREGP
jgi:hypothetical protein